MFETFFPGKLRSSTLVGLDPLLFLIFVSYGDVEITSLKTNKVLKVNRHRLKLSMNVG